MLSEEQVKSYEAQHGDVAHVIGPKDTPTSEPAWELVMRRPKKAEYRYYKTQMQGERTKVDANENLLRMIVVYPDSATFDKLLDKFWAIPDSPPVHGALSTFGGLEADRVGK